MKETIRRRARELGFDDCRFTTAHAPASAPRFKEWLAEAQHGEMGYLARNAHKRIDPQQVLPGANTVITLAVSYAENPGEKSTARNFQPVEQGIESSQNTGTIARYARFRDYHEVLGERLKSLTDFLDDQGGSGARSFWYVDTGPLLERDLAQRAGLGFIGKHTNLISRQLGNWIFLAEIITTLQLEPDGPEKNRCGTCTRCITACPTAAITGPFRLDARRCISYLTIELKGPIPLELRSLVGDRIYGCDDCLAVCPWNRFARDGEMMKSHARKDLARPDLVELLSLDDAGFKNRFAGTPIVRAKRRGFLRNVCVALGNVGDKAALPHLEKAARDSEPLIAEHARWAIGQIEGRVA